MAPPASVPQPPAAPSININTLLLAFSCTGSLGLLKVLLNGEDAAAEDALITFDQRAAYSFRGTSVELTPEELLKGVTVQGDTALHAVAANGDSRDFLRCADLIYSRAEHLLFVQNKRGDTPLHLAARAGKHIMVSHLIDLAAAISAARVKRLLRTENNLKETALHEAIRVGSYDMVALLMEKGPELARFPDDGTSPLYLAILLKERIIAQTLYEEDGFLSYSGPNGQNALHAAVLRGSDLTKMLLGWNEDLATQGDENGSTPLHFAAGLHKRWAPLDFLAGLTKTLLKLKDIITSTERGENGSRPLDLFPPATVCRLVLEANPAALYQSDHNGSFPIHVAAFVGASRTVSMFLDRSPNSAGLRDAKGRTFLHVAVEQRRVNIVRDACRNQSLAWILNMRDSDGNTALHLAVHKGDFRTFCALLMNLQVDLNLANDMGHTARDISRYKIPKGLFFRKNPETFIWRALGNLKAMVGASREDHFNSNRNIYQVKYGEEETSESDRIKNVTQNMSIGSVLIATVTFGANFALPGGYRADDHVNGGTPTLAGRYASHAFMMANTLSFICSSMATLGFMYSGSCVINLRSRQIYVITSAYLMRTSISSLVATFALAAYMVLAPVAYKTAIAICVMSSFVVLHVEIEHLLKFSLVARPYCIRNGLIWTLRYYVRAIFVLAFRGYWTIIFSFGWAAYAMNSNY